MRAFNRQNIRTWTLTGLTLLTPVMVYAADLIVFQSHTTIKSADVNGNFAQLDDRIGVYEDAISVGSLGNIGIGTTSPAAKLDISGAGAAAIVSRADGSRYSAIGDTGGTDDGGVFLYNSSGTLQSVIRAQGDSYIQGGNVGIGTTSPNLSGDRRALTVSAGTTGDYIARLEVQGTRSGDSIYGALDFYHKSNNTASIESYRSGADDSGNLTFWTKATGATLAERMRIDNSGNVGIGTTTPSKKLEVFGTLQSTIDNDYAFRIREKTGDNFRGGIGLENNGNAFLELWRDDGTITHISSYEPSYFMGGNVGIGTGTPAYSLDVNGEIRAVKVNQTSDARLKRDIRPLTHALEGIQCLQGVSYYLHDPASDQGLQLGLIAQDVERCYPELVSTDPEGFKGVSYDRLVAPLIEAVKEQQAQSVSQQHEIARLKAALAASRAEQASTNARLDRLEALISARK